MVPAIPEWIPVAADEALVEGGRLPVRIEGRRILLLRRDRQVYAVQNECPHLGCAFTRGDFEGFRLVCPCHDWAFDVRTGAFELAPEIKIETYACRIADGQIHVQLDGESDVHD